MSENPTRPYRATRVLAVIICVIGLLMVLLGASVYAYTTQQLKSQGITVAAVTADNPGALAGKPVAGPFTALAQVNAINHHVLAATGGKTFAELGNVATSDGKTYSKDVTAAASTDGQAHSAGDALSDQDAATYSARQTAQSGSFLQASLFVSVLAFGVSALIMILGVLAVLIAATFLSSRRSEKVTVTNTQTRSEKSSIHQLAGAGVRLATSEED